MDQKRLFVAIAVSIAILLGFQLLVAPHLPHPPPMRQQTASSAAQPGAVVPDQGAQGAEAARPVEPGVPTKDTPRLRIAGGRVQGSMSLLGAQLDDLVLSDYRETLAADSPLVRLLEPRSSARPYYVQYGWSAAPGTTAKLPDNTTIWTASDPELTTAHPVMLSWNNGEGLTFEIVLTVDDNYMFSVEQRVRNEGGTPVALHPWARIRRDYTPAVQGYYILFEGMLGVADGRLKETKYTDAKTEGDQHGGLAYTATAEGGWAGITDKYWLTSLIPDQSVASTVSFRHINEGGDRFQVDYVTHEPLTVAPGTTGAMRTHLFAGAKVVSLLDRYESQYNIPSFDKAVDFGWFYWLTKPIFYALDWLNGVLGNFGLAIIAFTVFVKLLFFPLANKSYKSMSKMKLLGPKMQALREQLKDDPAKLQQEMMALYRAEKVNPASGCLPMLIQIPVFFSLYKVIFVTIEMRQAPFFGWIHDLSQVDPTNVFNLFGLLPFDPTQISPFLHLGAWPLIMGVTMFLQQRLNPPPPDPTQARMLQLMPIVFTFMLARFPAGLVIYWTWNNLLSIMQQWVIMRRARAPRRGLART